MELSQEVLVALLQAPLSVKAGTVLTIIVGQGGDPSGNTAYGGGGGSGFSNGGYGAGGGGRSAIQLSGNDIITAGAGGGAGLTGIAGPGGGAAGGLQGSTGASVGSSPGGGGGTQSAGGAAGNLGVNGKYRREHNIQEALAVMVG